MRTTKKSFSSKGIQKQLGLKRYEPVWEMVHKLGKAIGNRDARYALEGMVELDEGYFTIEFSVVERAKGIRDKGTTGKSNVDILAESTPLESLDTEIKFSQYSYFKVKVLSTPQRGEINHTVQESINEKRIIFTDKSTFYIDISKYVELHITDKSSKQTTNELLKWVHITISNSKRNFLRNYYKIKGKYLQLSTSMSLSINSTEDTLKINSLVGG